MSPELMFVLITYVVRNGAIYDGAIYPAVSLYGSQADCLQAQRQLHLGADQKSVCAPVGRLSPDQLVGITKKFAAGEVP